MAKRQTRRCKRATTRKPRRRTTQRKTTRARKTTTRRRPARRTTRRKTTRRAPARRATKRRRAPAKKRAVRRGRPRTKRKTTARRPTTKTKRKKSLIDLAPKPTKVLEKEQTLLEKVENSKLKPRYYLIHKKRRLSNSQEKRTFRTNNLANFLFDVLRIPKEVAGAHLFQQANKLQSLPHPQLRQ